MGRPRDISISKTTQGQAKLLRLIDDLIRNRFFLRSLKKVMRLQDKTRAQFQKGNYYTWTPEEKKEHDDINRALGEIIPEYEKLKKRADKVMHSLEYKEKQKIAWRYGLDGSLISLAISRYRGNNELPMDLWGASPDMCAINSDLEERMYTFNKGMDWLQLNPNKQLHLFAYPFSVSIHRNATKRDVIDFIEKNWPLIDKIKFEMDEKSYRARKRKYDQKMLDFIWLNRSLPAKKLKTALDSQFPKNNLVYYELSKLIQLEKQKRLGEFEI